MCVHAKKCALVTEVSLIVKNVIPLFPNLRWADGNLGRLCLYYTLIVDRDNLLQSNPYTCARKIDYLTLWFIYHNTNRVYSGY